VRIVIIAIIIIIHTCAGPQSQSECIFAECDSDVTTIGEYVLEEHLKSIQVHQVDSVIGLPHGQGCNGPLNGCTTFAECAAHVMLAEKLAKRINDVNRIVAVCSQNILVLRSHVCSVREEEDDDDDDDIDDLEREQDEETTSRRCRSVVSGAAWQVLQQ
jgi:hypothetical protein